jgi:hypothetical protein
MAIPQTHGALLRSPTESRGVSALHAIDIGRQSCETLTAIYGNHLAGHAFCAR